MVFGHWSVKRMRPELARYEEGWRERRRRREAAGKERERRARACLPRLAAILMRRFGASGVWVFGSLVSGHFDMGSDIDLAVVGLARADLFRAGAEVEREAGEFRVDLVPLEDAHAYIREIVATEGDLIRDESAEG